METNKITLAGLLEDINFSHTTMGEKFYKAMITVQRKSGTVDKLPLVVPYIIADKLETGCEYMFVGNIRTRNVQMESGRKLEVYVFVREVFEYPGYDVNEVELIGFTCQNLVPRKTPLGRQITYILMAVNRTTGKSDYIPCIAWGRNARYASSFEVGTRVKVLGRIQSREYVKKISETETENRVAYEVSVSKVEV